MSKDMGTPLRQLNTGDSTLRHHDDSEKALEAEYTERTNTNGQESHVLPERKPEKRGVGSKLKRHCARFWWLHLIIFCVIFLIIALCLVYVGLPRIAQDNVNDTHLELMDLQFLNPTPDSLQISQTAILHNPAVFTPSLDAFDVQAYYVVNATGEQLGPMLKFQFPKTHALHPTSSNTAPLQQVAIEDANVVNQYVNAVLRQEYVASSLVGKTQLHLGALPVTNIHYNTTVHYKGLNALKGFNVTNARVNVTATPGTPNLKGNAFIPNPSVITVAMGNVTLTLSLAGKTVGNATIENMTIIPGDNNLAMSAIVDQTSLLAAATAEGAGGFVNLTITGQSAIYNGQHLVYYEKALQDNALSLRMNVLQVIKDSV